MSNARPAEVPGNGGESTDSAQEGAALPTRGVQVILEEVTSAVKKDPNPFLRWIREGDRLMREFLSRDKDEKGAKVATEEAPENLEEALKQLEQKLAAVEKEVNEKKSLSSAKIRGVVSLVECARELGGNDDPTEGKIADLFVEKLSKDKAGKILFYKGGGQVEVSAEKVDLEPHEVEAIRALRRQLDGKAGTKPEEYDEQSKSVFKQEHEIACKVGLRDKCEAAVRESFGKMYKVEFNDRSEITVTRTSEWVEPTKRKSADTSDDTTDDKASKVPAKKPSDSVNTPETPAQQQTPGQKPPEGADKSKTDAEKLDERLKMIVDFLQKILAMLQGREFAPSGKPTVQPGGEERRARALEGQADRGRAELAAARGTDTERGLQSQLSSIEAQLRAVRVQIQGKERMGQDVRQRGARMEISDSGWVHVDCGTVASPDGRTRTTTNRWIRHIHGHVVDEWTADGRYVVKIPPQEGAYIFNNYGTINFGTIQNTGGGTMRPGGRGPGGRGPVMPEAPAPGPDPRPVPAASDAPAPAPSQPERQSEGPSELVFIKNRFAMIKGMLDQLKAQGKTDQLGVDAQEAIANRRNQLQQINDAQPQPAGAAEMMTELRNQITYIQNTYLYQ